MSIQLNNQQVFALYDIENWWTKSNDQLYEISGGAGTGKTTLIRYAIERLGLDIQKDVAFIAFMGKASAQMARNGLPAQTIHSLIYNYVKEFEKDEYGNIVTNSKGRPKITLVPKLKNKLDKKVKLLVIDEAPMVNEQIGKDILSFGIPTIALGDLNQLPPVFGKTFFLSEPDVILTEIMRQAEGSPIVWLAQRILNNKPIDIGVYGNSAVISKKDINDFIFKKSDIVLTSSNKLRYSINNLYREKIHGYKKLDRLHINEKIICRRNNWNRCINDNIFLTNGMSGYVDFIDTDSYNGKTIKIDFKPDFLSKSYKNLNIDYHRLFDTEKYVENNKFNNDRDLFEFGYSITVHLSQGSQYKNVLFLDERGGFDDETYKKLRYTAITRAMDKIVICK